MPPILYFFCFACFSIAFDCELVDGSLASAMFATNRHGKHNLSEKPLISSTVDTTVRVSPQVDQQ